MQHDLLQVDRRGSHGAGPDMKIVIDQFREQVQNLE